MEQIVYVVHEKVKKAFLKVKRDVYDLRAIVELQKEAIIKLNENQSKLVAKIKFMESRPVEKPKTVTVTKTKVVKQVVKVAARKNYVGAITSMKVHSENCPFAKNINKENRVVFKSKIKPFNLGYKACKCLA